LTRASTIWNSSAVRAALLVLLAGCNLDTSRDAPYAAPPGEPGPCGTTEAALPKLLAFVEGGKLEPLREVLVRRLVPNEASPAPDPSLRIVLNALVRLIAQLGLEKTQDIAAVAARSDLEREVAPLIVLLLEFVDGRLDGLDHYAAVEAAGTFVRVCDPDHLLSAVELLLRLQSPSRGRPWIVAVLEALAPIVESPELAPFLEGFERNAERGRPAILSLLVQIMSFVAGDAFAVSRVETLLESAVYPIVGPELEAQVEELVFLLGEATAPEAGVLEPLQEAMRCGMQHGMERDELLGLAYDLIATEEIGLSTIVTATSGVLDGEGLLVELSLFADTVRVVRSDLGIRDDLRDLLVLLLEEPEAARVVPVLIDLFEAGVVAELLEVLVLVLDGCGR
jgi:hypothetical protein